MILKRIAFLLVIAAGTFPAAAEIKSKSFTGVVTDPDGQRIEGAVVQAIRPRYRAPSNYFEGIKVLSATKSDSNGEYKIELPDSPLVYVRATAPERGASAVIYQPSHSADGRVFFDVLRQQSLAQPWIILFPKLPVKGVVVDEEDHPVVGVEIFNHNNEIVRSDDSGKFSIDTISDLGDTRFVAVDSLHFRHPEFVQQSLRIPYEFTRVAQSDDTLKIKLERGVILSGSLLEKETRKPIANAGVSVRGGRVMDALNSYAIADAQGHYQLRVPVNVELTLTTFADKNYYSPERKATCTESQEENFEFVKGQSIRGIVKPTAPCDMSFLYVLAHREGETKRSGACPIGADGSFKLPRLSAGSYALTVADNKSTQLAAATAVELHDGEDLRDVEIPLDASVVPDQNPKTSQTAAIKGVVTDSQGEPAKLAIGRLMPPGGPGFGESIYTALDGSFTVDARKVGVGHVLWIASSDLNSAATITITDEMLKAPLAIKLQPTCEITGHVRNAAREPMRGIAVSLRDIISEGQYQSHRSLISTRTDKEGAYRLRGFVLPDEKLKLAIEAQPEYRPNTAQQTNGHDVPELTAGQPAHGLDFVITESERMTTVTTETAPEEKL